MPSPELGMDMQRREFITLLGGATAWPLAARAQQPAMPVIGYLSAGFPETTAHLLTAFRMGLSELGYVEGHNVAIEFRWGRNDNARLPELANDLVRRGVTVIATPSSTPSALAAKAATTTIPIVFYVGGDPVELGLVASLNRPGGNATGISSLSAELGPKRVGLLHELLPRAARFATLLNPNNQQSASAVSKIRTAAAAVGLAIEFLPVASSSDIDNAFAEIVQKRTDAVMINPDVLFSTRRVQIVVLAARHVIPTIFGFREDAEAGGLMSYGSSLADNYRQAGVYTGRILKGEKPADLPVQQPTKFELIVNLKTAKALGLEMPPLLLARADEVIE
jgi:putative ABC transport system substrate-binding protein